MRCPKAKFHIGIIVLYKYDLIAHVIQGLSLIDCKSSSSYYSLTVCRPGGLDLWNLLTSAQTRLMADAQAVTRTMLTRVRNIRGLWLKCHFFS